MKEEQERRGFNRESDAPVEPSMDRCSCCPYGCHIDREFLCLAEGTKTSGVELSEWKKRHRTKMKHRQAMESLLMHSALPASAGFSKTQRETSDEVTMSTTTVSSSDEQATNGDGSETNSILLELDETIAEALKSIDELMNSKTRRTTDISYEAKGEYNNSEELYASAKYSPERHPFYSANGENTPNETRSDDSLKRFMEKISTGSNEGVRSTGTTRESSDDIQTNRSLGKAKQHFEISDTRTMDEIRLNSTAHVASYSDSARTNEYSSCISREFNAMELKFNSSVDHCQTMMMTDGGRRRGGGGPRTDPAVGLCCGSSDLAEAMAVLLPYDAEAAAAAAAKDANWETLARLRQYIASGLRHMRNLEEQVKTIPVMQVRISVLKEEKKLLRLQLLSLQNSLPSTTIKDSSSVDHHFQRCVSSSSSSSSLAAAAAAMRSLASDSGGMISPSATDSTEMSIGRHLDLFKTQENFAKKKELKIGVNWSLDASSRSSEGQRTEEKKKTTTAVEMALAKQQRQLQRTTSLFAANNRLHEERSMHAPLNRATDEGNRGGGGGGNILRSASYSPQPDLSNRLLEFRLGSSETSCNFNQYSRSSLNRSFSSDSGAIAGLRSGIAVEHLLSVQNSWNAARLLSRRSGGLRSSPSEATVGRALSPPKTFNEPTKIRKVCLTNDGRCMPSAATTTTAASAAAAAAAAGAIPRHQTSSSSRHSFNVGIQCELLTAKKPMISSSNNNNNNNNRACCQCSCIENQRKRGLKDKDKTEETENGERLSLRHQTPDVIITHCQNNNNNNKDVVVDEPGLQNQLALKSVAGASNSKKSDASAKKSVDAITHIDDALLGIAREHSACQTDNCTPNGALLTSKDAVCLTDETSSFLRPETKDVGCFTDAFLSLKRTTDACCATDETQPKPSSADVSCLTDPWLLLGHRVLRLDAESNTDEELTSCDRQDNIDTMHIADTVTDRLPIAKSSQALLKHKDASCSTEEELKPESKEVGCSTDVTLNRLASKDASCSTDSDMLKLESREVSCLTDAILDRKVTKDACCSTDKELLSKEVSCLTETVHRFTQSTGFTRKANEFCCTACEISVGEAHCDSHMGRGRCRTGSASDRIAFDSVENKDMQAVENCCGEQPKASTRDTECITNICLSANKSNLTDSSDSSTQRLTTSLTPAPESLDSINKCNSNLVETQVFSNGERIEKNYPKTELLAERKVYTTDNQFPPAVSQLWSSDLAARSSTETGKESVKILSDERRGGAPGSKEEKASKAARPSSGSVDPRNSNDRHSDSDNNNQETKDTETSSQIPVRMSSEHLELNEKLILSCKTYSDWLNDSTKIASKQLNECFAIIQQEWFALSILKSSTVFRINQFLEEISKISPELRKFVVNMVDSNENTALHYAIPNRNFRLIDYLLSSGVCDVNRRNRAGCTAVMLASLVTLETEEHKDVTKRLIEMSDVNTKSTLTGQTALMLAASRDHTATVRLLLEAKANPNVQDVDGSTALMCASEHGYIATVRVLLSHPASDPSICDNEGSSAFSVAMEAGHRDIGVLLYAHINFKQNSSLSGKRHERRGSASNAKRL